MSGPINYHSAGIADYTHSVMTLAQELESIGEQARNIVSGLGEHFSTMQGSVSHDEAQLLIMQGINEGKEVFMRHSTTVDQAASEFVSFDHGAAGTFSGI
jgi:uncharacterized protein YukE